MPNQIVKWDQDRQITKGNYVKAAEVARKLKTAQSDIEWVLRPLIKAAYDAHKIATATLSVQLQDYKEAEEQLKAQFREFHEKNPQLKVDKIAFVDLLEPEIVNEEEIPDKYMIRVPDLAKIKLDLKANGMLFKCPGIKIKKTTQVKFYADKS